MDDRNQLAAKQLPPSVAGVRFGCVVADAGYGLSAPFRQGLTARKLVWAVAFLGISKSIPSACR